MTLEEAQNYLIEEVDDLLLGINKIKNRRISSDKINFEERIDSLNKEFEKIKRKNKFFDTKLGKLIPDYYYSCFEYADTDLFYKDALKIIEEVKIRINNIFPDKNSFDLAASLSDIKREFFVRILGFYIYDYDSKRAFCKDKFYYTSYLFRKNFDKFIHIERFSNSQKIYIRIMMPSEYFNMKEVNKIKNIFKEFFNKNTKFDKITKAFKFNKNFITKINEIHNNPDEIIKLLGLSDYKDKIELEGF